MATIELSIQTHLQQDRHTFVLAGELDLASAPELEGMVAKACADGAREMLLDLRDLRFIDSSGLKAILGARSLCETSHCELYLTPAPEPVQRLFELTGLVDKLRFRDSTQPDPADTAPR
jgi:anti-anti-sigma factor